MTALGPTPIVEDLLLGPVETDLGIAADTYAAIAHGHGNIV